MEMNSQLNEQFAGGEQKSDEELVKLVLEDQVFFVIIVDRYKHKLLTYIKRISGVSIEDAEDYLQNVFIKVYLNLNDFDNSLKFSSWIYRIAHNEVIDNFRKKNSRPKLIDVDIKESYVKEISTGLNILDEISSRELKVNVLKAIEQLEPKFQEVIILKYLEEKDYEEISDIIKKPPGTVASRINKAKSHLKKILLKAKVT